MEMEIEELSSARRTPSKNTEVIYLPEQSENVNTMNQSELCECNSYDQLPTKSKLIASAPTFTTPTIPAAPLPPPTIATMPTDNKTKPAFVQIPEIYDPELQVGPTTQQLEQQQKELEERKNKMAAKQLAQDVQIQVSMNQQEKKIAEQLKHTQGFGVFVNGAKLYLRSKHNKYLEGHPNGKVNLSKKKSDKTQWVVEYVGLNQIALKNFQSQSYLGTHGKDCALFTTREEKEIWRVEEVKGLYAFMNYNGRFLRGGIVKSVKLDDHCSDRELWNVELCF